MSDCPLFLDDREIGRLRWSKEGGNMVIWAGCPFEDGYIYRVYVGYGREPAKLYIGVMMPERNRFVISKKLPFVKCRFLEDREDVSAFIERRRPGEEERTPPLPFGFSRLSAIKSGSTGCGDFIENMFASCGGLWALHEGKSYFVAPWEPGSELKISSFFCLLTFFRHQERGYMALCVDGEGNPCPLN